MNNVIMEVVGNATNNNGSSISSGGPGLSQEVIMANMIVESFALLFYLFCSIGITVVFFGRKSFLLVMCPLVCENIPSDIRAKRKEEKEKFMSHLVITYSLVFMWFRVVSGIMSVLFFIFAEREPALARVQIIIGGLVGHILYTYWFALLILLYERVSMSKDVIFEQTLWIKVMRVSLYIFLVVISMISTIALVACAVVEGFPRDHPQAMVMRRYVIQLTGVPIFAISQILFTLIVVILGIRMLIVIRQVIGERKLPILKLSITLFIFAVSVVFRVIGLFLVGIDMPTYIRSLLARSIPESLGCLAVTVAFWPYDPVNWILRKYKSTKTFSFFKPLEFVQTKANNDNNNNDNNNNDNDNNERDRTVELHSEQKDV